jgi:signal transduction histidine kinase
MERLTTPVDLVLALALAVGAAAETWAYGGDRVEIRVILATATALALVGRRRHPSVSAGLVGLLMASQSIATESPDEIAVLLTLLVSAFSVAAEAARREALLGLGLLGMSIAVTIALDPSDSVDNIPPTLLLFLVLPASLGFAFRRRARAMDELTLDNETLQREAQLRVDDERRRIARELHDVVSHAVTLIAVQAEAGLSVLDRDPDAARRNLSAIGDTSRDALAELHSLVTLLREPDATDGARGLAGLDALIDGVRAAGLHVHVDRSGQDSDVSPAVDQAAYRVVQEALTNALRHSRRPEVDVSVATGDDDIRLQVTSTGARHQSAYGGTGSGLAGLRERVLGLGGSFEAGQLADDCYRVAAVLPRVVS